MIFGVCVGIFRRLTRVLRDGIAGKFLVHHYAPREALARLAAVPSAEISTYKVSVVIPVNNGRKDHIDQLIDSLYAQTHGNIEIIAVDSGSTDGTPEYLAARGVKIFHISPAAFRHDRSRNLGAAQASGDYLLFTVADCIFSDPEWIATGLRHLQLFGASSFSSPQRCGAEADAYARYLSHNHIAGNDTRAGIQAFGFIASAWVARLAFMLATPALRQRCIHVDDTNHLVRRDVFQSLQFRTHTCEDMAFGQDLIRSGHRFILSTLTSVTHFHAYNDPVKYFSRIIADYQVIFQLTRLTVFYRDMNSTVDALVAAFALTIGDVLASCDQILEADVFDANAARLQMVERLVTRLAEFEASEAQEIPVDRPGAELGAIFALIGIPNTGQELQWADRKLVILCARRIKSHLSAALKVLAEQGSMTGITPTAFRRFVYFSALNLFANNLAMALSRHRGRSSSLVSTCQNMAWK